MRRSPVSPHPGRIHSLMNETNIIPYEGSENYIFISYAHKNSKEVLEIMRRMTAAGYRIWYDDGIAPGSEWPEYIADHLNRASVVLAFVSPESIASSNCRREVTYALSKQKPFLGVILTPTKMSPGMEMQLSAQQCILRYNCKNDQDFYQKLLGGEILAPCRKKPAKTRRRSQPGKVTFWEHSWCSELPFFSFACASAGT